MSKTYMKAIDSKDLKIGHRFPCTVSNGEPNRIPGQGAGSRYYLRVTKIRYTRWYVYCDVQYENARMEEISGMTQEVNYRRDERIYVMGEREAPQSHTGER